MIGVSIKGGSISKALRDVRRTTRRKSFRSNRGLMKKASRRFRKQAKALRVDMSKSLARVARGLSLAQAKKRIFASKRVSGSKLHSEVFSRGLSQRIHAGRRKDLKVKRRGKAKGVYLGGKKIKGGFITRETISGKRELRRVLVRENRKLRAETDRKTIPRVFARSGPILLARHSAKLVKEIGLLVKKA